MKINFLSRIELVFWDFTIRALSDSQMMRSLLRRVYKLTHGSETAALGVIMGVSGAVGLVTGYMVYFLSAGVR
jgi:hypothetical protein